MPEGYFPDGLTDDRLLGGRVRIAQPVDGYRVAVDPVLLAAAVPAERGQIVVDFGAGTGAVGLCLAVRVPTCCIVSIEREGDLAALAQANARANSFGGRLLAVQADIANPPLSPASLDHVAMNPPYMAADNGTAPTGRLRHVAAVEGAAKLQRWIASAFDLVKPGGTITLIHRADRLDEILFHCRSVQAGGLTVWPIWPKASQPAHRVILCLRKADRSPMRLLSGLVLHRSDGAFTDAADAILRDAAAIPR
tara:strand:+ start:213 stop:965 length:753 start_codon:yes stop_codon:yes gene_type:complete